MSIKKSIYAQSSSYNIGDMTHCIQIQRRFEAPSEIDDISAVQGFKTIFEVNCFWKSLRADYIEIDNGGYTIAERIKAVKNAYMVIPFREDIDCECYVIYKNIRYKIIDIENVECRGLFLKCSLMSMGNINLKGNEGI